MNKPNATAVGEENNGMLAITMNMTLCPTPAISGHAAQNKGLKY